MPLPVCAPASCVPVPAIATAPTPAAAPRARKLRRLTSALPDVRVGLLIPFTSRMPILAILLDDDGTSVPVPTFVSLCSSRSYERRNQRDTSSYIIAVW